MIKKISVIIPTYNPQDYFYECIESLSYQNFPKIDFEVIIILNGDIKKYEPFVQEVISSFCHTIDIRFFKTLKSGVSNARNIGLSNAIGEYICFIDDDDVVSAKFLSGLYKNASSDTIVVSHIYSFKNSIQEKNSHFFCCQKIEKFNIKTSYSLLKNRSLIAFPVAKIIHKNIISNRKYDSRFKNGEDTIFMTTISNKIKRIIVTEEKDSIYYVRERIGSASRKHISFNLILKNCINMIHYYVILYIKYFPEYNLLFILSRIPAAFKTAYNLLKF